MSEHSKEDIAKEVGILLTDYSSEKNAAKLLVDGYKKLYELQTGEQTGIPDSIYEQLSIGKIPQSRFMTNEDLRHRMGSNKNLVKRFDFNNMEFPGIPEKVKISYDTRLRVKSSKSAETKEAPKEEEGGATKKPAKKPAPYIKRGGYTKKYVSKLAKKFSSIPQNSLEEQNYRNRMVRYHSNLHSYMEGDIEGQGIKEAVINYTEASIREGIDKPFSHIITNDKMAYMNESDVSFAREYIVVRSSSNFEEREM
jgi:hypothetical protein